MFVVSLVTNKVKLTRTATGETECTLTGAYSGVIAVGDWRLSFSSRLISLRRDMYVQACQEPPSNWPAKSQSVDRGCKFTNMCRITETKGRRVCDEMSVMKNRIEKEKTVSQYYYLVEAGGQAWGKY